MRAHYDEDNARAALLLEQAAYAQVRCARAPGKGGAHLTLPSQSVHRRARARAHPPKQPSLPLQLRAAPPCRRKFGFQLVLAGLRFHAARQRRLAAHCYQQVRCECVY